MKFSSFIAFCLLPLAVHAADEIESSPPVWKGAGEIGFTSTSGNADSKNLNANLGIKRNAGPWKHIASLQVIRAEADGETVADSLVFIDRSEYSYSDSSYLFLQLRYGEDEFSGYDYQASIAAGPGYRFSFDEKHDLDVSFGPGYRRIKDSETRDTEDEGIITSNLLYLYKISKTAEFSQEILIEAGEENTYTESETALKSRINSVFSTRISYLVKHNSDVPEDTDKTDEIATISLVYEF